MTLTVSCNLKSTSLNIVKVFGIAQLSHCHRRGRYCSDASRNRANRQAGYIDSAVLDALPATLRLATRGNKTMHVDGNDTRVAGPDESDATINQAQFRQNAYNE